MTSTNIPDDLAKDFNERYPGLNWDGGIVAQILLSFDEGLGETYEDHLECFADHQILVNNLELVEAA
jgi:hypothetical protein